MRPCLKIQKVLHQSTFLIIRTIAIQTNFSKHTCKCKSSKLTYKSCIKNIITQKKFSSKCVFKKQILGIQNNVLFSAGTRSE